MSRISLGTIGGSAGVMTTGGSRSGWTGARNSSVAFSCRGLVSRSSHASISTKPFHSGTLKRSTGIPTHPSSFVPQELKMEPGRQQNKRFSGGTAERRLRGMLHDRGSKGTTGRRARPRAGAGQREALRLIAGTSSARASPKTWSGRSLTPNYEPAG